jgi:hypothetical protein
MATGQLAPILHYLRRVTTPGMAAGAKVSEITVSDTEAKPKPTQSKPQPTAKSERINSQETIRVATENLQPKPWPAPADGEALPAKFEERLPEDLTPARHWSDSTKAGVYPFLFKSPTTTHKRKL